MNILTMTKEDFDALPYLHESDLPRRPEFDAFVIIPTNELHDSGWGCMAFVMVDHDNNVIGDGKIGGGADVVNLDGIGGYGYKWHQNLSGNRMLPAKGWTIDCIPCGYLRIWTRRKLFMGDRWIGSTFEVYSEDKPRKKDSNA